jgi:hypothetical protein
MQGYEPWVADLLAMQSPEEMAQAKNNIDREIRNRNILDRAGGWGTAAEMAASIMDPAMIPLLMAPPLRLAAGMSMAAKAGAYGAVATAETLVQEGMLHATQTTRTREETLLAAGATFLLGGALGGVAHYIDGKGIAEGMTPADMAAHSGDAAAQMDGTLQAPGLSAQRAVDREQISLVEEAQGETFGVKDPRLVSTVAWINPLARTATAQSPAAVDIAATLAENSYQWMGRTRDAASEGAVETLAKIDAHKTHELNHRVMTDDYAAYRQGGGQLSVDDFMTEISLAMWRGHHDNPVVAQAAGKYIQRLGGDDIGRDAILRTGLLDEGQLESGVKIDQNYLHRMWNKDYLVANEDQFVDWMTNYVLQASEGRIASTTARRGKAVTRAADALAGVQRKTDEAIEEATDKLTVARADVEELRRAPTDTQAAKKKLLKAGKKVARAEARLAQVKRLGKVRTARAEGILEKATTLAKAPPDVVTPVDAQDVAREIHRRIVLGEAADMEWQDIVGKAGPLHQRMILAPSADLADQGFLITNIADIMDNYTRKVAPQIRLAERYGSVDMEAPLARVSEEYSQLISEAPTARAKEKLRVEQRRTVRDIKAMRDVIRGVYKVADPDSKLVNLSRNWRALEALNSLGGVLIASAVDVAIPIARYGLRPYLRGMSHTVQNMALTVEQAQRAGGALDNTMHSRLQNLVNPGEYQGSVNQKLRERAMGQFSKWTGLSWWNTHMKGFVGNLAQDKMLRGAHDWAAGTLSKKGQEELLDLGVDEAMARAIAEQPVDKAAAWTADTTTWTDPALVSRYHANMVRQMDTNILVPGAGDVPLWARGEWGKLIAQFKSFAFAATNRLLIPALQRRDARAYTAVMGTLMLAGIANTFREFTAGKGPEEWTINTDPTTAALDAISYSGFTGLMMEPYGFFKYNSGQPLMGLAGPALGSGVRDIGKVASIPGDVLQHGSPTEGDLRAARRLAPYQNLFYFRWLVDQVEQGIIETTGAR